MRPTFSEFSYGYAVTRELETIATVALGGLSAPPLLPSLKAEKDLGFDVQVLTVRLAVFVQFKLGEFISKPHSASPTWSSIGKPHYRTRIDTADHQFQALLDLERRGTHLGRPLVVLYVAPAFWEQRRFWAYYSAGEVLARSYAFAPSDMPADGQEHHRIVTSDLSVNAVLSELRTVPNRARPEALVEAVFDSPRMAGTEFSLVSLEQQMRAACAGSGLAPLGLLDALSSDDRGPLDQIHMWSQLLGVAPLIWVDGDTDSDGPDLPRPGPDQGR